MADRFGYGEIGMDICYDDDSPDGCETHGDRRRTMAKATEITVDVSINISDETICRCLRILEMWMDDNPDKTIIVEQVNGIERIHHKIHIEPKRVMSKDEMETAGFETWLKQEVEDERSDKG